MNSKIDPNATTVPGADDREAPRVRRYEAPRIQKRRALSRATLYTGTGTDTGGLIGPAPTP